MYNVQPVIHNVIFNITCDFNIHDYVARYATVQIPRPLASCTVISAIPIAKARYACAHTQHFDILTS